LDAVSHYPYVWCIHLRFSEQKSCASGVINILKRTYETEIQSASIYETPTIRDRIVKKWEDIKIILV
jgi:hypothetical protein